MYRKLFFSWCAGLAATGLAATVATNGTEVTVTVPAGETYAYVEMIDDAHVTKFTKAGEGTLTMDVINFTWTAPIFVDAGMLQARGEALGTSTTKGSDASAIHVAEGATFYLNNTADKKSPSDKWGFPYRKLMLAGTGSGGQGAFRYGSNNRQNGGKNVITAVFYYLDLTADATIQADANFSTGDNNVHYNGHTLNFKGPGAWQVYNNKFNSADKTDSTSRLDFESEGTLTVQGGGVRLYGDARNQVRFTDRTGDNLPRYLTITADARPATYWPWKLVADANLTVSMNAKSDGTVLTNTISGPVEVMPSKTLTLRARKNSPLCFTGGVTSAYDDEQTTATCGTLSKTDVGWAEISGGTEGMLGTINVGAGTLKLKDAGHLHQPSDATDAHRYTVKVASLTSDQPAELDVGGSTILTCNQPSFDTAPYTRLTLGVGANSWGLLTVRDGAVVTNDFVVGGEYWTNGEDIRGAVYQLGGSCFSRGCNNSTFRVAWYPYTYGYWGLKAGTFGTYGVGQIGGYGNGFFHQLGGRVVMEKPGATSARYLALGACNGGYGEYCMLGGSLEFTGCFALGGANGANGKQRGTDSRAVLTFAGDSQVVITSNWNSITFSATNVSENILNIADKADVTLRRAVLVSAAKQLEHVKSYVNVDGGAITIVPNTAAFSDSGDRDRINWTVYEGGLTVNTPKGGATMYCPIRRARGKGLAALALPTDPAWAQEKYIGPQRIRFSSSSGAAASAVALFDETTRAITNLLVTSAGFGYSDDLTATLDAASPTNTTRYACAVTLKDHAGKGGFTKKGVSKLTISATGSDWLGLTDVQGGTLAFAAGAYPADAPVHVAADATLDVQNDKALTLRSVSGAGTIFNAYNAPLTISDTIKVDPSVVFCTTGLPLTVHGPVVVADGVRLVVPDVDALDADYRTIGRAVVLKSEQENGVTLNGQSVLPVVDSKTPEGTTSRWFACARGANLVLCRSNGTLLIFK